MRETFSVFSFYFKAAAAAALNTGKEGGGGGCDKSSTHHHGVRLVTPERGREGERHLYAVTPAL